MSVNVMLSQTSYIFTPKNKFHNGNRISISQDHAVMALPLVNGNLQGQLVKLKSEDGEWTKEFQSNIINVDNSSLGNHIICDGPFVAISDETSGFVTVYKTAKNRWQHESTITPAFPLKYRNFGKYLAADNGHLVVAGVRKKAGFGAVRGTVFYYDLNEIEFRSDANYFRLNGPGDKLGFGSVMAIHDNTLFISSKESIFYNTQGSVAVYNYQERKWKESDILTAPDGFKGDGFGYGLDTDEDFIAVSANKESLIKKRDAKNNEFRGGIVYIYENTTSGIALKNTITPPENINVFSFGEKLAINNDNLYVMAYFKKPDQPVILYYQKNCIGNWELKKIIKSKYFTNYEGNFDFDADQGTLMIGLEDKFYQKGTKEWQGKIFIYEHKKDSSLWGQLDTTEALQYTSPSGKKYYTSEQFLDTIQTDKGCDSIIQINLTIENKDTPIFNADGDVIGSIQLTPLVTDDRPVRKLNPKQELSVTTEFISLEFYDNATLDNDSISIKLNDSWVILDHLLTDSPHVINAKLRQGENQLVFRAENLGTEPPNTCLLIIKNWKGEEIRKYSIRSDLENSYTIKINYQP